eukprot:gnl/Hemi2/18591_TR6148_c0_g1_i1.p1 gnl/Hemi2/18591_TR6148_c0_g1~~gnl/Hemi2/18591_TR6148_c0_g1_i1.p1  ORF type:complete len:282 (+),score=36.87 gnl/Hemi2/18591_TR6148_c0_g1_i1:129-848(+)
MKPGDVCKFFPKGQCKRALACPFRHLTKEKVEKGLVCKHWLRGLCKRGNECEFLHEYDLSKMPECYFFSKFGECSNPYCMFQHITPDIRSKECQWYLRGFCKHGVTCRHKHVRKKVCLNYMIGFCPDGLGCQFGHPKFELPREDDDLPAAKKQRMVCHRCNQEGHKIAQCPVQLAEEAEMQRAREQEHHGGGLGPRPLDQVTCYKCGAKGHYANRCPTRGTPTVFNPIAPLSNLIPTIE